MVLPAAFAPSTLGSSLPAAASVSFTSGQYSRYSLPSRYVPLHVYQHKDPTHDTLLIGIRLSTKLAASISTAHDETTSATKTHDDKQGVGIYVHIPYCRRRCRYCDFAIVPVGSGAAGADHDEVASGLSVDSETSNGRSSTGTSSRAVDGFRKMDEAYREAVLTELDLIRRSTSSGGENAKIPLRSIYFGGGTPSLAPASTLRSIVSAIVSSGDEYGGPFYIPDDDGNDIEITIEMDPGTFTEAKLLDLRDAGFNRISLGVQSFDDNVLKSIGRIHRRADVLESIDMIRRVFGGGEDNYDNDDASSTEANNFSYSVDLISGLPGLSLAKWAETLETAVNLHPKPDHLSLYDLQVEEGTVFGKWYGGDDDEEGEDSNALARTRSAPSIEIDTSSSIPPSLPTPDECAYMYRYASGYLRAKGYEHYEISSYARSGRRSKHNQMYWEVGSTWYAIGLGATSSISRKRFARPQTMADYIDWVGQQKEIVDSEKGSPSWLEETDGSSSVCDHDILTDVIMTRLRTIDGLDLSWIKDGDSDGEAKLKAILRGAELALDMDLAKRVMEDGHDRLQLNDPDGFLFSNNIVSQIFVELDELEDSTN